jgi:hypothetical protein
MSKIEIQDGVIHIEASIPPRRVPRPWNDHGPRSVTPIPIRRLPVPNTLQYPLERHRDIQRRWQRLLQRTAAPKDRAATPLKHLRTVARLKMPISAVASSKATS